MNEKALVFKKSSAEGLFYNFEFYYVDDGLLEMKGKITAFQDDRELEKILVTLIRKLLVDY